MMSLRCFLTISCAYIACENRRFSSLIAAGENAKRPQAAMSEEKRYVFERLGPRPAEDKNHLLVPLRGTPLCKLYTKKKLLNAEVHRTQELNLMVILPDLSCERPRARRHLDVKIQKQFCILSYIGVWCMV